MLFEQDVEEFDFEDQPDDEVDMDYEFDDAVDEDEDPDRQGMIRTVDDAHLVYKRRMPDSTFEELWIYNINTDRAAENGRLHNELRIQREILSATDIPRGRKKSEDGTQEYSLTTMGNVQMMHITGLVN